MKEKDPWIKNFRQRMEDYEEPVPTDLWGQLEQELQPVPRILPWYRRWQAAAAVGLVLLASTLTVWFWQSSSVRYLQQQSAELPSLPGEPGEITASKRVARNDSEQSSEQGLLHNAFQHSAAMESAEGTARKVLPVAVVPANKLQPVLECPFPEENPMVAVESEPASRMDAVQKKAGETLSTTHEADSPDKEAHTRKHSEVHWRSSQMAYADKGSYLDRKNRTQTEKKWSVGITTGNCTFASTTRCEGYLPLPRGTQGTILNNAYGIQVMSEIDKLVQFKNLSEGKNAQSEVNYKLPVTVGASLRFDMNTDWAFETGLTYTMLSSETRSGTAKNHYGWEDELHYVGIPVKVHRRIWDHRRFEVYASLGGTVEKCVKGQRTLMGNVSTLAGGPDEKVSGAKEDLEVHPLQCSLSAAVGAQFKWNDHWGLYAEPGVAYYFDDGSDVETIRKAHPFQFNLQVGLRFTFSE